MSSTVECPYCEHENEVGDYLYDAVDNKFDFECESCEKEFEVEVEYEPTFSAGEIIWVSCQSCGTETREPYKRGRVYPFPKNAKDCLCEKCWKEGIAKEWEAGRDVQEC
ncbi:hypothetical protein ACX93W_05355 [Paenibacillus sp. CAU 1782]